MSFFRQRFHPALIVAVIVSALLCDGCHHKKSAEERKLRHDLQQALTQHSYRDAELLARRILQSAPNDNGIWGRLVQAQCGAGNLPAAKETFAAWRSAVRRPSSKLDEYIGDVALAENNPAAALQAWHRLLGHEPRHLRVLTKVARLEQQQDHWMEAETAWSAALEAKQSVEAVTQRSLCRKHLHHWPEALADLNRARQIAPKDPEVVAAGKLFDRLSKFLAEIRDLDAELAVSPNDTMLLTDRCLLFLRSEDFELALDDADAAGKLAPWAVRPKLFGGLALLRLGRVPEAESHGVRKSFRIETLTPEFLETIRRLDSEISVERTNAELYATRAWHLNEMGQPVFALQDATVAAQLDPKSPSASAEKAYALMKLGRADEAFEEIQHATTLDPNYATAWQYRGELEMERRDYLAAIESLSRAFSLNQTVAVLERREACYRMVGWTRQADEDRHMLEQLTTGQVR